jgi:hypothetical protein
MTQQNLFAPTTVIKGGKEEIKIPLVKEVITLKMKETLPQTPEETRKVLNTVLSDFVKKQTKNNAFKLTKEQLLKIIGGNMNRGISEEITKNPQARLARMGNMSLKNEWFVLGSGDVINIASTQEKFKVNIKGSGTIGTFIEAAIFNYKPNSGELPDMDDILEAKAIGASEKPGGIAITVGGGKIAWAAVNKKKAEEFNNNKDFQEQIKTVSKSIFAFLKVIEKMISLLLIRTFTEGNEIKKTTYAKRYGETNPGHVNYTKKPSNEWILFRFVSAFIYYNLRLGFLKKILYKDQDIEEAFRIKEESTSQTTENIIDKKTGEEYVLYYSEFKVLLNLNEELMKGTTYVHPKEGESRLDVNKYTTTLDDMYKNSFNLLDSDEGRAAFYGSMKNIVKEANGVSLDFMEWKKRTGGFSG